LEVSLKGGRDDTVGPGKGTVPHGPLQTILDLANVSDYRIEAMDGVVTMFAPILARLDAGEASAQS
jgi:simple sugar transport system permease protein